MSETYGRAIIQASAQVLQAFNEHRDKGLRQLVAFSGAESAINDDCDVFFDELQIVADSGCFYFENHYFPQTVKRLAASANNVGLYLHVWDEYGGQFFLAKNPEGEQYAFFAGGPEADDECEEGDLVQEQDLQRWLALIPAAIKTAFPEFIEAAGG